MTTHQISEILVTLVPQETCSKLEVGEFSEIFVNLLELHFRKKLLYQFKNGFQFLKVHENT